MAGQATLAQQWRQQYPGAYDDLSDQELEQKILAKYPDRFKGVTLTPEAITPNARDTTGDVPFLPDWANDAGKGWVAAGPSRVKEGIGEIAQGNISRGADQVLRGGLTTALPMVAPSLARSFAAAPMATAATALGGGAAAAVGGELTESLVEYLGGSDDQAQLAGDVGALGAGYAGAKLTQAAQQAVSDLAGRYGPAVRRIVQRATTMAADAPTWAKRAAVDRALRVAGVPGPLASRAAGMVITEPTPVSAGRGAGPGPGASQPSGAPEPAALQSSAQPAAPSPVRPSGARTAAAASPAAPTPQPQIKTLPGETLTVPAAERTAGQMSEQALANDLGLSARRMGATLSEEGFAAAGDLVRTQGMSPAQAVAQVASGPPMVSAPKSKLRVTQEEAREYARLLSAGKTDSEATESILTQRKLIRRTGATAPGKAKRRVATRQATGRWPDGTP